MEEEKGYVPSKELMGHLMSGSSTLIVPHQEVLAVTRTDQRGNANTSNDFSVNIRLASGNKISAFGMLDVPSDVAWLDIEAGDRITFSSSGEIDASWDREDSQTGAVERVSQRAWGSPQLLDRINGTARQAFSKMSDAPENGWESKLRPPRANKNTAAGGGGAIGSLTRGRQDAETGSAAD